MGHVLPCMYVCMFFLCTKLKGSCNRNIDWDYGSPWVQRLRSATHPSKARCKLITRPGIFRISRLTTAAHPSDARRTPAARQARLRLAQAPWHPTVVSLRKHKAIDDGCMVLSANTWVVDKETMHAC